MSRIEEAVNVKVKSKTNYLKKIAEPTVYIKYFTESELRLCQFDNKNQFVRTITVLISE
jgi:hypothetical protein